MAERGPVFLVATIIFGHGILFMATKKTAPPAAVAQPALNWLLDLE